MSRKTILDLFGVAATAAGLYLLYALLKRTDFHALAAAISHISPAVVLMLVLFTIASNVLTAVQEGLAVRYAAAAVSPWRVAMTSVAAVGIGHCVGFALLSGGFVRYRMYARAGLTLGTVGEVIVFSAISAGLGILVGAAIALLFRGAAIARLFSLSESIAFTAAVISLACVAIYWAACALWRRPVVFRSAQIRLPSFPVAVAQTVVGTANILCVAAVLYYALGAFTPPDFGTSLLIKTSADAAAGVMHVPGGWGLLEYITFKMLNVPQALMGALLFRGAYYLLPLVIALVIFAADDGRAMLGRSSRANGTNAG
jgi:uncharacterized membrane protein YbhN (UPF0104 family)